MDALEALDDVESQDARPTTRRVLLLGALGGVGALIANSLGRPFPAEAAAGDPVRAGRTVTAGTANTALTTKSTGAALRVVQSGTGRGIQGQTTRLVGVDGIAKATTGAAHGVQGLAYCPEGIGVAGFSYAPTGPAQGVFGSSESLNGAGVQGNASGIESTGVAGYCAAESGVAAYGVYGDSASTEGVGVVGWATATSGSTSGVAGAVASPDGWAGKFSSDTGNGVYISVPAGKAGLNVVAGTKNAVVSTPSGARLLYSEEATEVLFADYGFGRLVNGSISVRIDATFAATVDLTRPYHVFLQAYGPSEIYAMDRTETGFSVRSRGAGDDQEFSYRIVAVRRGYQGHRMELAPWADADANLHGAAPFSAAQLAAEQGHGVAVGAKRHHPSQRPVAK